MYIQEYEFFNIFVLNKKKKQFLDRILNIQSEVGKEYKVHWSFLKKSSLRRNKIKVKCDECKNTINKRLCDLHLEINEHFCRSCGKKGNRNGIFGLHGELNPIYGIKRDYISGDKNPSRRPEVIRKISEKNRLTSDIFIQRLKEKNLFNEKYNYSKINYFDTLTPVEIICDIHGSFEIKPCNLISGSTCPKCKKSSKGENYIENILKEKNIEYIAQKMFDKCRGYKRPLPFDFYLPDYNICIEFDGRQHFEPVQKFGGIKRFNELIKNDIIKNEYCYQNNIKLIRISYKEKDKIQYIIEQLKLLKIL